MERKKVILSLSILLIVMIAVGYFLTRDYMPPLSKGMKAKVLEAYITEMVGGEEHYNHTNRLVWFDENGGKRDRYVFRYFGTYGDCIVILRYGSGLTATGGPVKLPKTLPLARPVQYPVDCSILLYNTNPDYPTDGRLAAPITSLINVIEKKLPWLTDAQFEQLTDDLEAWIAKGNY